MGGVAPLEAGAGDVAFGGVAPLEAGAGDVAFGGVGTLGGARGCCCRGEEKWKQDGYHGYHLFSSSYTKLLKFISCK